jgi:hypothetical protein
MVVTNEMVQQAVTKATQLGLLPRKSQLEDIAANNEIMLEILQSALNVDLEAQNLNGANSSCGMWSTQCDRQGHSKR